MSTREIIVCGDCGQIANLGYTDGIGCADEHKERVLQVEAVLTDKEYFAEDYTSHHDGWFDCEVCKVAWGVIHRHTIIKGGGVRS